LLLHAQVYTASGDGTVKTWSTLTGEVRIFKSLKELLATRQLTEEGADSVGNFSQGPVGKRQ
jgi:hypothetical protein